MKVTKQTTYNWEAGMNVSEQKTRDFANYLLGMIDNKPVKQPLPFEIAPKPTEIQANWEDARLCCFSLNIDGKTGWRLPTMEELFTIYQSPNDFEKSWYWSSSEFDTGRVWIQSFHRGEQYYYNKRYHTGCVRAVRDLKDD